MLIFIDGTRLVLEHSKGDREEGLYGLKPWEATATQSLIQMMCREMLVLEEKELVCGSQKENGGRKADKTRKRMCLTEKCVDLPSCAGTRDGARVRV